LVPRSSGASDIKLLGDNIHARFWIARAKQESGGIEPTPEQVVKVRDRYRQ
jgi:hypothetical protein